MSGGKFVGEAVVAAVLKLNPFGPEGYARRDRNKAYRKARRKQKRGEPLTADELKTLDTTQEVDMNVGAEIGKSLVRHFGSGAAGAIVGTGVASADDANIFIQVAVGLLIFAATQGWSIIRKTSRAKAAQ